MSIINENERQYLLDSMEKLLDEYDYEFTEFALNLIIDKWAAQKTSLIEAFKKHPNYIEGRFMIAFTSNYERVLDEGTVREFSRWLNNYVMDWGVHTLPEEINQRRIEDECCWLPDNIYHFFNHLSEYACQTLDEARASHINEILPNIKARAGQRMSRVINKICVYLGYDKHPEYNREFAKFADSLNPLVIKRHTVISLNPLDYLTMSFGNSWASCHTIDKQNKRGMPNAYSGMYSSGTMSYMLDPSSMVLYTTDSEYEGTDYWTQPKIHRQMFHWGQEKLVQGRLYPQDNDSGGLDYYNQYRNIVQEVISKCFEFDNLWTVTKGSSAASRYTSSYGTHYRDYSSFSTCTLSRIKDSTNDNYVIVGAEPICIECGYTHSCEENINCCAEGGCRCADCGCYIDEDDSYYVDGDYYCPDCVSYCDDCDEYHRDDSTYLENYDRNVCPRCLNEYYVSCYECGEYVDRDEAVYDEETGEWYCDECAPEREEEE